MSATSPSGERGIFSFSFSLIVMVAMLLPLGVGGYFTAPMVVDFAQRNLQIEVLTYAPGELARFHWLMAILGVLCGAGAVVMSWCFARVLLRGYSLMLHANFLAVLVMGTLTGMIAQVYLLAGTLRTAFSPEADLTKPGMGLGQLEFAKLDLFPWGLLGFLLVLVMGLLVLSLVVRVARSADRRLTGKATQRDE